MDMNVKQLYEMYIEELEWKEKLELLELLMQATLELIDQEKEKVIPEPGKDSSGQPFEEKPPVTSDTGLTDIQKQLLNGPVMAEEDYVLYKEKKEHFAQWK